MWSLEFLSRGRNVLWVERLWVCYMPRHMVLVIYGFYQSWGPEQTVWSHRGVRTYCCSCWGGSDSGIPLILILFLLNLSTRSSTLSFELISSVWALWAFTKEFKEVEYFPMLCLTWFDMSSKTSTSCWQCFTFDTSSENNDSLCDSIMSFSMVSDTGWPIFGEGFNGVFSGYSCALPAWCMWPIDIHSWVPVVPGRRFPVAFRFCWALSWGVIVAWVCPAVRCPGWITWKVMSVAFPEALCIVQAFPFWWPGMYGVRRVTLADGSCCYLFPFWSSGAPGLCGHIGVWSPHPHLELCCNVKWFCHSFKCIVFSSNECQEHTPAIIVTWVIPNSITTNKNRVKLYP